MQEDFDYAAIRDGLRRLREAADPRKAFGADAHGFQAHSPLSEQAVGEFETRHRVRLPADYRGFLIHVGNGGAGPAYGLFKLGEMDDDFTHKSWHEADGFVGVLAEPFPHTSAWNDLAGEPEYDESIEGDPARQDEYDRRVAEWERVYWDPKHVNGAIPICHLGCACRQWLVLTGPEAGHVWNDDRADRGGLAPAQQNGRERVTFLQWYTDWLDLALLQLRS